ncbi:MAG: fasciclin domain-containing protein [Chitinophagaceae bacterium]|nr:MAG: fasciclin domain-containing protein [Chitinophagaceae bacterium]
MEPKVLGKKILLCAGLAVLMSASVSCNKDDDDDQAGNTIADQVVANGEFSLLERAVVRAGLAETLSGAGPFTVFAPDDDAFAASGLNAAAIDATSPEDLRRLLLYHTLTAEVAAAAVPAGPNAKVSTANSPADSVFVTRNSSGVFVNGVKIVTADVQADNGIIHVPAAVIVPPSGNMVATAQSKSGGDTGLDSLVTAIVRVEGAAPGLISLLNSNVLTVFAPTNKAFRDLLSALSLSNVSQIPLATLQAVLAYHLVQGRVFSSALANGNVTMFSGSSTTINLTNGASGGPTVTGSGNGGAGSNIVAVNIMATNGVVHVIDRVLLP